MTPTHQIYEFLLRKNTQTDTLGMHVIFADIYRDDAGKYLFERLGDAQPVAAGSDVLAQMLTDLNAAALVQVQDLTARLATVTTNAQAAANQAAQDLAASQAATQAAQQEAASKEARIEALEAQLAAATAPAPQADTLALLDARFEQLIPDAAVRAQFAVPWALVRVHVQAGKLDYARAVIEQTAVPPELAAAKAEILAALA